MCAIVGGIVGQEVVKVTLLVCYTVYFFLQENDDLPLWQAPATKKKAVIFLCVHTNHA